MARVKIEGVLDHLDSDLRQALEKAVRKVIPDAAFDGRRLYKEFVRQAYRKCSVWESVPDSCIEAD